MDQNNTIPDGHDAGNNPPPERPGTPERPPYSPLTPVLSHLAPIPGGATIVPPEADLDIASLSAEFAAPTSISSYSESTHANAANRNETGTRRANLPPASVASPLPPPTIQPEPSPVPISESDNADAIALRSAISLLQMQKRKALSDIKTLDEMKRAAAADPEGFSRELLAGRLSQQDESYNLVDTNIPLEEADDEEEGDTPSSQSKFGKIPKPQNVVRMPPINWAKYQIVGEPLDKMHEEQRNRPFAGLPRQDPNQRAPEHVIAAPYRPLTDKLESPTKGKVKKDRKT